MKKLVAGLIAAAVASVAMAQDSTPTTSKNAVGFINIDAKAGEMYALTIPFDNMDSEDGSWVFDDTQLANDADRGSYVYFWENQGWTPGVKRASFSTKHTLKPGEVFFFKPAKDMVITMAGEVPDADNTAVAIESQANLSAVGNPYPVPMDFDSSSLAQNAKRGSYVYFWENGSWVPSVKRGSFSSKKTVEPGRGFFFKTTDSDTEPVTWDVEKAYDFP